MNNAIKGGEEGMCIGRGQEGETLMWGLNDTIFNPCNTRYLSKFLKGGRNFLETSSI